MIQYLIIILKGDVSECKFCGKVSVSDKLTKKKNDELQNAIYQITMRITYIVIVHVRISRLHFFFAASGKKLRILDEIRLHQLPECCAHLYLL